MPHEVYLAVSPIVYSYLWLLPAWVMEFTVRFTPMHEKGETVDGSANCSQEYRWHGVFVHGSWLDDGPVRRRSVLIHEMLHAVLAPMVTEHELITEKLVKATGGNEVLREYAEEQWRQRFEGIIVELVRSITSLPVDSLPAVAYSEEFDSPAD